MKERYAFYYLESVWHDASVVAARKEAEQQLTSTQSSQDTHSIIDDTFLADEISDYQPSGNSEVDTDMEAPEIDDDLEEHESVAKSLSSKVSTATVLLLLTATLLRYQNLSRCQRPKGATSH